MIHQSRTWAATLLAGLLALPAAAQPARPVSLQDFTRAETDRYFAEFTAATGGLGRLQHERALADVNNQPVIRMNRDTLYSKAIVDLDAGPATITIPDTAGRFLSLLVIDQDHFNPAVISAPGQHVFTRELVGTRYAAFLFRTFVDPNDPADLRAAHATQDGLTITQPGTGHLDLPNWDSASLNAIRGLLNQLANFQAGSLAGFGRRGEVDPVAHLVVTAAGWGGNPPSAAIYANITPSGNDGTTVHRLRLRDVPVDGFWSITVYNRAGFMEPNPLNAYSVNNVTARREADGAVVVQFGGCMPATPNCLPTPQAWNSIARLYRPRPEVLSGAWHFPAPEAVR